MPYASRDGNGFRVIWHKQPQKNERTKCWVSSGMMLSQLSDHLSPSIKLRSIFPAGVKPGECVKIRLIRAEVVK